jgi:dephospho-CoA kinase
MAAYDPTWQRQAERLMSRIRRAAGGQAVRIDHIGSTAVPGLAASDVIDLQLSVRSLSDADELAEPLAVGGFIPDPEVDADHPLGPSAHKPGWWKRLHTNADPARPVDLHLRVDGQHAQRCALLFRDWLRADAGAREEYVAVRQKLATAGQDYPAGKRSWLDEAFHRAEQWAHDTGWRL